MKVVIVQKWPVWLKTQVVDSYFSNKNQIEVENDDSFIPENSIQCLPDNYPSELDIASKSLAITRLKNVVNSIEKDVDVLVFINGINIDGKVSPVDYVYTNEDLDVKKRIDVLNIFSGSKDNKEDREIQEEIQEEAQEETQEETQEEAVKEYEKSEVESEHETIENKKENETYKNNESVKDESGMIRQRRDRMHEDDSDEEEPAWLQNAASVQKTYGLLNMEKKNLPPSFEEKTVPLINEVENAAEQQDKKIIYNTFVVYQGQVVLELKGVLLPSLIRTLAPQRVIVPLENGSVVMISGTKKLVRIAQWTIDVDSFDEIKNTYTSVVHKSSHEYDLRTSNNEKSASKAKNYYANSANSLRKGAIKTLHSLKKRLFQRR